MDGIWHNTSKDIDIQKTEPLSMLSGPHCILCSLVRSSENHSAAAVKIVQERELRERIEKGAELQFRWR